MNVDLRTFIVYKSFSDADDALALLLMDIFPAYRWLYSNIDLF